MAYHTPRSMEIVVWFQETFGDPQQWEGEVLEPVELKHGYQWATGKHKPVSFDRPSPCIWCTEKAYMMYVLRWF